MAETTPTPEQIDGLIAELRRQHQLLVELASGGSEQALTELAEAIDAIGANLLVADEELRVQNENLAQSARRLDLLVAAHEQLFANSTTAFVQTDTDGLIVRYNRTARRLLGLPETTRRSWTLTSMVKASDRPAVRSLVSRLRSGDSPATEEPPLEVTVVQPCGETRPVVMSARLSDEDGPHHQLLHWELLEPSRPAAPGTPAAAVPGSATPVQLMASAAAELDRQDTVPSTLDHVVHQACTAVPDCDEVGITLVRARNRLETPAATGSLAAACDELQYRLGEGPCVGVIGDSAPIVVPDMSSEARWPRFAAQAAAMGVGSMMAVPLSTARGVSGALNFYATAPRSFDGDAELVGRAYATHAAIALANAELEATLRAGMQTRQDIGCAVGILIERHRISARAAFEMLVRASQQSNRKLRDIAAAVCESGEEPDAVAQRLGRRASWAGPHRIATPPAAPSAAGRHPVGSPPTSAE